MIATITIAVLALTSVALAIRMAGLRKDAVEADAARVRTESQLQSLSREFVAYRERMNKNAKELQANVLQLEQDFESCADPNARRAILRRLLSQAPGDPNNHD